MKSSRSGRQLLRVTLAAVVLVAAVALLPPIPPNDSVAYWAAARQMVTGADPYDAATIHRMQRSVGFYEDIPFMVRNPPWTLPLIVPFGWMSYPTAALVWTLVQVLSLAGAAVIFWQEFAGEWQRRVLALVLTFTFAPIIDLLGTGQLSGSVALGVALMLRFTRTGRQVACGIALALLALKPHLFAAVWPALGLWVLYHRRWKVALSFIGTLAALLAGAFALWPHVFSGYLSVTRAENWNALTSPTLSGLFRAVSGAGAWAQYAAAAVAMAVTAVVYWRNRRDWNWAERLPVLMVVSLLVAPYGFFYDQTLLLAPLIAAAIVLPRNRTTIVIVAVFAAVNVALLVAVASRAPAALYSAANLVWAAFFFVAQRVTTHNKRVFPQAAS